MPRVKLNSEICMECIGVGVYEKDRDYSWWCKEDDVKLIENNYCPLQWKSSDLPAKCSFWLEHHLSNDSFEGNL